MLLNCYFILYFCLGFTALDVRSNEDPKDIIKKIRSKYKDIETLVVSFEYHFKWKLTGKDQSLQGKFYFQKENKIRYELGDQLNVTDGSTVWQFSKVMNQVIIDRMRANTKSLFMPKYFLYDYLDKFRVQILEKSVKGGKTYFILKMIPHDRDEFVQSLKIWVSAGSWLTEKIEYVDLEENTVTYEFKNIQTDKSLGESVFTFDSTAGMDVIDLR